MEMIFGQNLINSRLTSNPNNLETAGQQGLTLQAKQPKWAWWTWPLLLIFLIFISYGSYFLRNFTDSVLLYLPTPFAIILLYWYGPRMLPVIYLNEIATLVLWGAPGGWVRITLLATHAPLMTYASWYLFKNKSKEKPGELLSSTNSLIRFTLLGVLIPVLINSAYTYNYTFVNKDIYTVALIGLADFLTIFTLATPLLYFLAPGNGAFRFIVVKPFRSLSVENKSHKVSYLWIITIVFVAMIFIVDFNTYWYVYGVASIIVAIQRGFASVIIINAIIFVLNYILPLLDFADLFLASKGSTKLISVHLGMATMFVSSSLIGRVISDLWKTEYKLVEQKEELENANQLLTKTNAELDRFVYSLSHDISAPLKSIRGLVNLSKIEKEPEQSEFYLSKIESSINRLETFIAEVLDYSRTNRKDVKKEEIHLPSFVEEIIQDFKYLENFGLIKFELNFDKPTMTTDRFLLKVILSNLIANAIKYQRNRPGETPYIKISSSLEGDFVKIRIEDNGEGIASEYKEKIFEMFYRGSNTSTGSGLGLYITKEATEKLFGRIELASEAGKGSSFTVFIPLSTQVKIPF